MLSDVRRWCGCVRDQHHTCGFVIKDKKLRETFGTAATLLPHRDQIGIVAKEHAGRR